MKKIYVFGTRGFPGVQGGVEKHCEYLYPELTNRYDITVYRRMAFLPKGSPKSFGKIRFIDLPSTRIKGFESFFHSFFCTISCIFKRPDIVHIHNIGPAMFTPFLKLFGLKVVLTYHSPNYEHKKWGFFARKILKASEWLSTKGADKVIFINKQRMAMFPEKIRDKSILIPNGVEIKGRTPDTNYLHTKGIIPEKYILAVGRITEEKGFSYLIDAFVKSRLSGYQLVIAGGIDHTSKYASDFIQEAENNHVITTGYVDGEDLRQLYSHARLFILPSYNEGFPLVLLEAMGYQLPILASDISANKLVGLNDKYYFRTGYIDDLSRHIKDILAEEKQDMFYDLSEYTWRNVAVQVSNVYTTILK